MKKDKLHCYAFWKPGENIVNTWSGTSWNLYQGLKSGFDTVIEDADRGIPARGLLKLWKRNIICPRLWERLYYGWLNRRLKQHVGNDRVLMISEVLETRNEHYCYFDNIWATEYYFRRIEPQLGYRGWPLAHNIFKYASERQLRWNISRQYRIMASAKAVFCMGRWLKDFIDETYPELADHTYHVGGGINTPPPTRENGSVDRERPYRRILFVGTDFALKGGDLLVEAYHILKQRMPGVRLTMVGVDEKPQCVTDDIEFCGRVKFEEVGRLMRSSDLFCLPTRFDAYCIAVIEALANGLPVVTRNVFELPSFVEEGVTGEFITNDDAEYLALQMEKVLNNPSYKEAVVARHDRYISEYSWETVCRRMIDIMNK